MKYLGASLENMAGARLEKTLEKLTDNRIKGLILGVLVTAVIQSSSAAVGIVQAVAAAAGNVTFAVVAPVVMGISLENFSP